jgi:basic membrane protein A
MKKFLVGLLVVLLVPVFLAGFTVTMVTDTGGLGDQSFNDGTWAGVQRAVEELGVTAKLIQSFEQADYVPNLSTAAAESDVVLAVGFLMQDALETVAPQYPDTHFLGIDIDYGDMVIPNVKTYTFREEEAAFLVGFLAAAMTKSNTVGFIGGIPIPPVQRFEWGYTAGIQAYNTLHGGNVRLLIGYTQSFGDVAAGKSMTEAQFSQGADISFAAAGACGLGTFDAAQSRGEGFWAIGVDLDQDHIAPGSILASAVKRIDNAAFYGILDSYEGYFVGGHEVLGFKEDGAGISPMTYTRHMVPDWIIVQLAGLRALVVEGAFEVPDTLEKLNNFVLNF